MDACMHACGPCFNSRGHERTIFETLLVSSTHFGKPKISPQNDCVKESMMIIQRLS
jgi:hypothetical protein